MRVAMAARVLLQRRSVAVAVSAVAAAGMALAPSTALAEAPPASPAPNRKPIYDDFDASPSTTSSQKASSTSIAQTVTEKLRPYSSSTTADQSSSSSSSSAPSPRGPTPTDRLAQQIGHARMALYRGAVVAEDRLNATMDSALGLEQSFTTTIASLAPPRASGERLMPGSIYVLVAAMAGSIIARNRNILVRASLPVALGVAAGWAVMPLTMRNVSDLAWTYEQRMPAMADAHLRLRNGIERGASFAKVHSQLGVRYVDQKVTEAREAVEGWVKQGR